MARSLRVAHQKTLGADIGYDTRDFVSDLCISGITPHVAQNNSRSGGSAIDGRSARHQGYDQSINAKKRIEQVFGWIKQAAGLGQLKARGRSKVKAVFRLQVVTYKLIRITSCSEHGRSWHAHGNCPPRLSAARLKRHTKRKNRAAEVFLSCGGIQARRADGLSTTNSSVAVRLH